MFHLQRTRWGRPIPIGGVFFYVYDRLVLEELHATSHLNESCNVGVRLSPEHQLCFPGWVSRAGLRFDTLHKHNSVTDSPRCQRDCLCGIEHIFRYEITFQLIDVSFASRGRYNRSPWGFHGSSATHVACLGAQLSYSNKKIARLRQPPLGQATENHGMPPHGQDPGKPELGVDAVDAWCA